MSQFTPNFLGQPTPSEVEPDFSYNLFGGLQATKLDDKQQVLQYSLPDEFMIRDEQQRKLDELSAFKLFAAVDKTDPNFKETIEVGPYKMDTFIGMREGPGLIRTDRETVGEQELNRQTTAGSGVRGIFAEQNREWSKLMVKTAQSDPSMYAWDANDAYDWAGQNLAGSFTGWAKSLGELINWVDTTKNDNLAFNTEAALKEEAKGWSPLAASEATQRFLEEKPEVAKYFELTGIDPHQFTRLTKNPLAWVFQMNQAVIQAQANLRMGVYEQETGWLGKQADKLYYGVKDPTMARDLIVTTLASYGMATGEVALARLATTGAARAIGASSIIDQASLAVGRYGVRGLSGGPLTGPIENFIFQTSKAAIPTIGEKGFQTALARSVAIMGEAATFTAISAARMQEEDYRFKHLLLNFGEYAPEFKYDYDQIFTGALEGGLLGLGMFGTLRLGLGGLGDIATVRAAKPGEKLSALSRNIANSLDSFSSTIEGRTVFGNKLGQNRGVAFGNWLDRRMQGLDNRNTASIVVNGKALYHFDGFSPEVTAKTNFNEAKSREIVSLWAKTTNTVETPEALFDPEVLASKGLTYDDVISTLKDFKTASELGVEARKATPRGLFEAVLPYESFEGRFMSKTLADAETVDARAKVKEIIAEYRILRDAYDTKVKNYENQDIVDMTDSQFAQRRQELATRLSETQKEFNDVTTRTTVVTEELNKLKAEAKATEDEIAKLNKDNKQPNALKNVSDKLNNVKKQITEIEEQRTKERDAKLADLDKKQKALDNKRKVYDALPVSENPTEVAVKKKLYDDLGTAEEKLNAKREKVLKDQLDRKAQRELNNLNKEKTQLEELETAWQKKSTQQEAIDAKQKEADDLAARREAKDSFGQSVEERLKSRTNDLTRLDEVRKEAKEYDAKVSNIRSRVNEQRSRIPNKNDIVFLGLTDKLRKLTELKEKQKLGSTKDLDAQIKELEDYLGGEEGIKEATRAKIIEDTINNRNGFGTANTILNVMQALNIQSLFGKAEQAKLTVKDIVSAFRTYFKRDPNFTSRADIGKVSAIIMDTLGKRNIKTIDNFTAKIMDLDGKKLETDNGGLVNGKKVSDLFRTILGKVDKRTTKPNANTVIFVSDRDFTVTTEAKAGLNNIIKITVDENGLIKTELAYGKLEVNEKGDFVSTKSELFNDSELTADNVIDTATFRALLNEWNEATNTILKQQDDATVKLLGDTLKTMEDDMKQTLVKAQLLTEEVTRVFSELLNTVNDTDITTVITQLKKTLESQLEEAKNAKTKSAYRDIYTGIIGNLFALEEMKKQLGDRISKVTDAELKTKLETELKTLDDSKFSVSEAIKAYHNKPKVEGKVKETTKPTVKPEELKVEDLDFGPTEKAPPLADPVPPTIDNLKLIFGFGQREAVVGSIIMKTLGSPVVKGLTSDIELVKYKDLGKDEIARIFMSRVEKGTKAIISVNDSADLFTISHEMGHYARYLFLDPLASAEERTKIGLTDSMYDKIMNWLGATKDKDGKYGKLSEAQEEKFANGFALYILKLLEGDGKAANTGIQFAFNKLGEHIGDLGDKFKSMKDTKGMDEVKLTPEATEVYSALLTKGAEDNITTIFMEGFKDVITTLSEEERNLLGQRVLGEMKWEAYKAEQQKLTEAAAKTTSVVAETTVEAKTSPKVDAPTTARTLEAAETKLREAETPAAKIEAFVEKEAAEVAATRVEVKAEIDSIVAEDIKATVDEIIKAEEPPVAKVEEPNVDTTKTENAEMRLKQMLKGLPFRIYEGDPRFNRESAQIDGITKALYNEITQDNLAEITNSSSVFHETNIKNAIQIIQNQIKSFFRTETIFVSSDPTIALGQAGSGIKIEFDTSRVNGTYGTIKPGQEFLESKNLNEFKIDSGIRNSILSIEVKSESVEKALRKNALIDKLFDWGNPETTEYGIKYLAISKKSEPKEIKTEVPMKPVELTLEEITNIQPGTVFEYVSSKSKTKYKSTVKKITEQEGKRWILVVSETTSEDGTVRRKTQNKDVAWWFKNKPTVMREVVETVPEPVTREDAVITKIEEKITEVKNTERTPESVKNAETKAKEADAKIESVAETIKEVEVKQEEAKTAIILAVRTLAPQEAPRVEQALEQRIVPDLSFMQNFKSETLDTYVEQFRKAKLALSFLSSIIGRTEVEDIAKFAELQKNPQYKAKEARGEGNPELDISTNLKKISGLLKTELNLGNGTVDLPGLPFKISPELSSLIEATASKLGFKNETFLIMVRATFAVERAKSDHIVNTLGKKLKTAQKRLAEGKKLDAKQKQMLEQVKTIADIDEQAREVTIAKPSSERMALATVLIEAYGKLLRRSDTEDAVQNLFIRLLTKDNILKNIEEKLGPDWLDPNFLKNHFENVKQPAVGDPLYNLFKRIVDNEKLSAQRKTIGQKKVGEELKVVDGQEVFVPIIQKIQKEGTPTIGKTGDAVEVFEKLPAKEPELNMSIESATAAVRTGHVFASLFKFIQDQGETDVLMFFVAKMQAIEEGQLTNYKAYIQKLFDLKNIKRNGKVAYNGETLKTLEAKSERFIAQWISEVEKVEPEIAKAVREILPEINKRKEKGIEVSGEQLKQLDTTSFAQSIKQLKNVTQSAGDRLLAENGLSLAQSISEVTKDIFENVKVKKNLNNLLLSIQEAAEKTNNKSIKEIVDILLTLPKDKELLEQTRVSFKDNIRAMVFYDYNEIQIDSKDSINVILHEISHGLTAQFIQAELSRVTKVASVDLSNMSMGDYLKNLLVAWNNDFTKPELKNLIHAYFTYLKELAGVEDEGKVYPVFNNDAPVKFKNWLKFQDVKPMDFFIYEKSLKDSILGDFRNTYLLRETLQGQDKTIVDGWMNFKSLLLTLKDNTQFNTFVVAEAPTLLNMLYNTPTKLQNSSKAKALHLKAIERIIREYNTGLIEGEDYFIVKRDRLEEGRLKSDISVIYANEKYKTLQAFETADIFEEDSKVIQTVKDVGSLQKYDFSDEVQNAEVYLPYILRSSIGRADTFVNNNLHYAASNLHEFTSEIFTNRNHALVLDQIKVDNYLSAKSLVINAVRKFWNLSTKPEQFTLLEKTLSSVEDISKRNKIVYGKSFSDTEVTTFAQASKKLKTKGSKAIAKAEKFRQDLKTSKGRWFVLATKLKELINEETPNLDEIAKTKEEMNNILATISVRRKGLKALGLAEDFSEQDVAIAARLMEGLDPVDDLSARLGAENANRIITAEILEIKDPEQKLEYIKAFRNLVKTKPQLKAFLRELEKGTVDPGFLSKVADEFAVTKEEDEPVDILSLREMSTETRREFIINKFMPTIAEALGERAGAQNILSKFFESVPGGSAVARQFQRRAGGSVSYADTVNSPYLTLAFLSKILDPNIDVRNGELSGKFKLFSMEEAEAESKLILTSSGIPDVLEKIQLAKLDEEQLKQLNAMAWQYLTKQDELPSDTPYRDLVLGLIQARNKFNTLVSDYLKQHGGLGAKLEDPESYGTSHRPSIYAINNPDEFVKALTKHEVAKFLNSDELNGATLHAMGWIEISRANDDGHVDMVVVREDSPIAKMFDEKEITKKDAKRDKKITWGKARKRLQIRDEDGNLRLSEEALNRYYDALQNVTDDYLPTWVEYYKNFENPTAIFISMRTAKDRILRVPEGESDNKSLSPKTYFANKASDYTEERLFTHDELVADEELSKFYNNNVLGLTVEETNIRLFQHVVTKKLTELFGVRLSFDDLMQFAKLAELNYVKDIDTVSVKERESFFRGWEKIRRSWLQKTHRLSSETSDYDPSFRWLMESSPGIIMALGGMSAGTKTIVSELPRALLASDRNKSFVTQFVPNFLTLLKYSMPFTNAPQRRLALLKQASAIHWTRAVLEDTFSANYEHSTNRHDYVGPVLGRQGWWRNLWGRWKAIGEANRVEKTFNDKASNVVAGVGWMGGSLLRWSNEMVNIISMHNALHNLQTNIGNFRDLATMLNKYGEELEGNTPRRGDFNRLARSVGLSPEEALDLSRSGLLDLETINILHKALTKDYKAVTTEGLPDSAKLLKWAETLPLDQQPIAKNAVYKLAGYIKTLARNTNTEPTLLDTRVTIDPVARALRLYTQFGTSNSVQSIGRARRAGNVALARFVAGQFLMQVTGGLIISYLLNMGDDEETINEIKSSPVAFVLSNAVRMPVYGNYSWLFKLLTTGAYQTYAHLYQDEVPKSMDRLDVPNVIDSPFQYRFDAVTKDFEKMPGIITRYMEGKTLTPKQKAQAIDSIPFLENSLLSGFIKDALSEDVEPMNLGTTYEPQTIKARESMVPQRPVESPRMPLVQPMAPVATPRVETPRAVTPEPVKPRELEIPSRPIGLQGVSSELADLLSGF